MAILDRDIYLRNYVMGVLVSYSDKGLNYSNMGELADSITRAVIEGDSKWQSERMTESEPVSNCCFTHTIGGGQCVDEDVPQ